MANASEYYLQLFYILKSQALSDNQRLMRIESASPPSILLEVSLLSMTSNPGPRVIIIDDKDNNITYSSGWSQDDDSQTGFFDGDLAYLVAPTYQHTLHSTQTNSSFSYKFQGTAIHIKGATNRNDGAANDPDPGPFSWVCAVDGKSIPVSPEQRDFLYDLCASGNLTDGTHILTVNVTSGSSSFWLDSIHYVPSENSPALDTAVVLIDDSDPGIEYTGWQRSSSFYNTTTTSIPGSTMTFNFTGKAISWVTVMPADDTQLVSSSASYTINGGDPVLFNFSEVVDENPWGRIIFTTPDLTPGSHTLSVTYHGNSTVQAGGDTDAISKSPVLKPVGLSLDYLLVTHAPIPPSKSTVSTSPAATHSVSADKPQSGKTNKGINKAAIAGGVVAGLILLCSLFAIIFVVYRGKRRRRSIRSMDIEDEYLTPSIYSDGPRIIEPFYIVPEMRQTVLARSAAVLEKNAADVGSDSSQEESGQSSSISLEPHSSLGNHPSSSSSPSRYPNSQPPLPRGGTSRVVQHEDSGVRLPPEGSVVEVPPQYTEA